MFVKTTLSQQMRLTTQMVLSNNLLRLSREEFEEAIASELASNPALEGAGLRRAHANVPNRDDGDWLERVASSKSAVEQLLDQARLIAPSDDLPIMTYLIYALDDRGFLTVPEDELAGDLHISPERAKRNIAWLRQLDPPGIGARDVRECFLLQCCHLETQGCDCKTVCRILDMAWDDLLHQQWKRIAEKSGLSEREVLDAFSFIQHNLCPYPLSLLVDTLDESSVLPYPDIIIHRNPPGSHDQFSVEVPAAGAFELRVNPAFRQTAYASARVESGLAPAQREWIQQAMEHARLYVQAVEHRWSTLSRIAQFLVEYQADFFQCGPRHLKPLTRTEIAQRLGLHESTISRAVSDKVLQLPNGRLIPLGDLFDRSLAAKEAIRQLVAESSEPLSDREIAQRLECQSFQLSRRTIAKYREQLGIPAQAQRKRVEQANSGRT
jgi:RNA polymerase sigma-54 factor